MKDVVSVIITVYNMEKYLNKCIESVVNQTYKNIEIIIVDDGSTDGSSKIIERYRKKYNNIKSITQENGGPAIAKNKGLDNSNGKYIMMLDADDWIDKDFIEKLVLTGKKDSADVIFFDSIKELPNGEINGKIEISKYRKSSKEEILKMHITSQIPAGAHKIIKKDVIIKSNARFADNLSKGEELQFTIQAINASQNFSFSEGTYYHCLQRGNSQSRKEKYNYEENVLNLYETLRRENLLEKCSNEYNLAIIRYLILEMLYYTFGDIKEFRKKIEYKNNIYNKKFGVREIKNYKFLDKRIKFLYLLIKYRCYFIFYMVSNIFYKSRNKKNN